jgi:hypothetical protein
MKFRLLYEGEIAPRQKAKIEDIHAIRMALDAQLRALWQFPPLSISAPSLLQYIVQRRGNMTWWRLFRSP